MNISELSQLNYLKLSEVGPTDGLIGWWKLNGDIRDYSGYGNHSTVVGSPDIVGGVKNSAYNINGLPNSITTGISDIHNVLNDSDDGITLSCWVKLNGSYYNDNGGILLGGNGHNWGLTYYKGNNKFSMEIWGDDGSKHSYSAYSNAGVLEYTWYHVVGTLSHEGDLQIYVNGELEGNGHVAKDIWFSDPILRFGSRADYWWVDSNVCGGRLYNRILTNEEVMTLYKLGLGNSKTLFNKDGTIYVSGHIKEGL